MITKQVVINLQEEQRIGREAEALARLWYETATNPDPASREIFRFMPPLLVEPVIYEKAKKLLEIKMYTNKQKIV